VAFNPLDYPLAWIDPLVLSINIDFVGHIPFVMSLVDLMRPNTIVELGTHTGNSYCAICQAVHCRQLPTKCFAVDTWKGDLSIGAYDGDAIFNELRRHHDPNYGSFSTLMRMTFDSALDHFADASIDLLHIDGCHTYEAVRHDFETWLPKLSDRGVVILHDTAERREGFGVWKFWEEISGRYPSINFEHSHGLGMLVVGEQPALPVGQFMLQAAEEPERIRQFFGFQGNRVEKLQESSYMLIFAWQAQTTLNNWCSTHGKQVNPHCGPLQLAQSQPAIFLRSLKLHTERVFGMSETAIDSGRET
jgi:methyltransferase family protein